MMIKRISDIWKLNLSELYIMLGTVLGCGILGMIMTFIIVRLDDTVTSYAPLGSFMAVLLSLLFGLLVGIFTYGNLFNTAVAFGCTRKEFIVANGIVSLINTVIDVVLVAVIYLIENAVGKILYPGMECENLMQNLWDYRIIFLAVVLFLPLLRMFFGALILKFQTKAFWGIWALWMLFCIGGPGLSRHMENNPDSFVTVLIHNVMEFMTHMSGVAATASLLVIAVVLLTVATALLRKQSVA